MNGLVEALSSYCLIKIFVYLKPLFFEIEVRDSLSYY